MNLALHHSTSEPLLREVKARREPNEVFREHEKQKLKLRGLSGAFPENEFIQKKHLSICFVFQKKNIQRNTPNQRLPPSGRSGRSPAPPAPAPGRSPGTGRRPHRSFESDGQVMRCFGLGMVLG